MENMRKLIIGLTALLAFLFLIPTASALAYTWSSAGAGFCFLPTEWTPFTGGVPTMAGDSTTFDATSNIPPMTCGISGYDSETLASGYGSLLRHTANLVLLNGGLSVDNSQWSLAGPRTAHMGQFITQCTSGCPLLDAKITLEPNSYMEVGGEPLNCTVGSDSLFEVNVGATLNCTSGASIAGGANFTSDGLFDVITSTLDLDGFLDCGATNPGICDLSTVTGLGSGTLQASTGGTIINAVLVDYAGLINLTHSELTTTTDFISTGTAYLTGGISDLLTFADFNIAYLDGHIMNVSGTYLNFTGVSTIEGNSHITQKGGQVRFNAYSNIINSTFDAHSGGVAFRQDADIENTIFNTNDFSTRDGKDVNISNSVINAIGSNIVLDADGIINNSQFHGKDISSSGISGNPNIENSLLNATDSYFNSLSLSMDIKNSTIYAGNLTTIVSAGTWDRITLFTHNASISGGMGLNITDSNFDITGNFITNMGTGYTMLIDPTVINISGNWTINNNTIINVVDSIINVEENVFILGGGQLNLTNSLLNVTGNISLADNSSWLNLTGHNDPLGGSFIDYCYYGLGTPNIHDVGGSIHNAPLGYNQFSSKCFGLNITYPLQSSVHTTSPVFFQVVLWGDNATLQTPPSTWELYRMASPQWLMDSGNFSNYTWAHWQGFNGAATGWHKLIASTNMTVPGAIPTHVIRNGNNSFHRGEVTFYWNGTPIAPSNATTINVNITQSIGINESDSTYAQAIVVGIAITSAVFAYLSVQVSAPVLSMLYLGLFHLTLVIGVAVMLKIGEAFITANLLSSIEPFYTLTIFALIFIVFYIVITFIINSWRSIAENRVRGPVDE